MSTDSAPVSATETAALAWADETLDRFGPAGARAWRRIAWRMFRPTARLLLASGYVGGYTAAGPCDECEGAP